ncbi:MAG TPA: hypothetical protein VFU26_07025 [Gaiellaceae bacterium]|nr:hypothetical protein [Gaiellaceae bacterium]
MHSKFTLAFACACSLAVALVAATTLRAETTPEQTTSTQTDTTATTESVDQRAIQRVIDRYRHETWRWQRLMGHKLIRNLRNPPMDVQAKIAVWKQVAQKTRLRAQNPPHKQQWLCIHRFEGAWNDPNPPYYGGLQMDLSFQRTYGRHLFATKGTADRWTPLEQMWVAERAHRAGRGFFPWPNTARFCGLI